ncbi:R3H domain-containing protein 4-like [Neocloeon triangulifer]|uniref:R3H domain-containing protein 4-like n=1 Tax=Neocloeon triangulifer TaxID=2078957 RepID=UPI00286F705C|nr:R3H domain-containing protein 4-like [Neocloeon triangulifer]
MGVIDRKIPEKNNDQPGNVDNQPTTSDDELSIPETVSSQASTLRAQPASRPSPTKKPQLLVLTHPGKHSGKRRMRHFRDVEDLMRWNEKDEYEMTIYDFMSNRPSPFAILLQDDNLLKAWWEFIHQTNQDIFLKKSSSVLSLKDQNANDAAAGETKRLPMPSEYKRIERHLKEVLQRKSTDPAMVFEIEDLLIKFFAETPKEVLRIKKLTKYESFINQAVCQYHGLDAEVDETNVKKRKDLVVTLDGDEYTQPNTALGTYIEQRQKYFM